MSSFDERSQGNHWFRGRGFALGQDESSTTFAPHGSGALTRLLRSRSQGSINRYGSTWQRNNLPDDEETAILSQSMISPGLVSADEDDAAGDHYGRTSLDDRRLNQILLGPQMRSMRLIGSSNPRYNWSRYWKTEDELRNMKKPLRKYYERNNYLIQQYLYIDRLLDSSLPHDLLNEYSTIPASHFRGVEVPDTIAEETSFPTGSSPPSHQDSTSSPRTTDGSAVGGGSGDGSGAGTESATPTSNGTDSAPPRIAAKKVKRTPKNIYRPSETTPLFQDSQSYEALEDSKYGTTAANGGGGEPNGSVASGRRVGMGHGENDDGKPEPDIPWLEEDDDLDSGNRIVTLAIYVNFAANVLLLAGKIAVVLSMSSMSVLASLVDAVLDFLSTVIVWITTWLISRQDRYKYPVGRRRLEPIGVVVFSVIMITCFAQVALESIQRLAAPDHSVIKVGVPALATMVGTVVVKGLCWLWCRMVKNSSVQALAADAMTDVIFNLGSIFFPIVGYYAGIWWFDALGGLLLSVVVVINWSGTSMEHIKNLSGFSATADQRNILLYLTMRFAKTIKQIQGLQAYHAGDKLNVEVDIILDASTPLRDSHDVSESLSYVLESVPVVDRAFVHVDYATWNLPTHMEQQQQEE